MQTLSQEKRRHVLNGYWLINADREHISAHISNKFIFQLPERVWVFAADITLMLQFCKRSIVNAAIRRNSIFSPAYPWYVQAFFMYISKIFCFSTWLYTVTFTDATQLPPSPFIMATFICPLFSNHMNRRNIWIWSSGFFPQQTSSFHISVFLPHYWKMQTPTVTSKP